jgi:hypothetical protein
MAYSLGYFRAARWLIALDVELAKAQLEAFTANVISMILT